MVKSTLRMKHHWFTPGGSVEVRLNSGGTSKNTDAIVGRLGSTWTALHDADVSSDLTTSVKYEASRKDGTKKVMGEVVYTPTILLPLDRIQATRCSISSRC